MGNLRCISVQSFKTVGWIFDTSTVVLVCTPWPYFIPVVVRLAAGGTTARRAGFGRRLP
jgi:hypothetical protein